MTKRRGLKIAAAISSTNQPENKSADLSILIFNTAMAKSAQSDRTTGGKAELASRILIFTNEEIEMLSIRNAVVSGFIATIVAGSILVMKNAMRVFPDVHIPQTLSTLFGWPDHIVVGGVAVFLAGTLVLSLAYAWIAPRIPVRAASIKGLVFGFAVWLAMMLLLMPAAGAGLFAANRSTAVPAFDLVLMLVYGLVLATMYARDTPTANIAQIDRTRGHA
ncbi:MAG: DUF6789 family protein [Burkholderiales bacterium]